MLIDSEDNTENKTAQAGRQQGKFNGWKWEMKNSLGNYERVQTIAIENSLQEKLEKGLFLYAKGRRCNR